MPRVPCADVQKVKRPEHQHESSAVPRPLSDADLLPDARDGLTRVERVVLATLAEARAEFGERTVPTALLYGRVVEHVGISPEVFVAVLQRLGAAGR